MTFTRHLIISSITVIAGQINSRLRIVRPVLWVGYAIAVLGKRFSVPYALRDPKTDSYPFFRLRSRHQIRCVWTTNRRPDGYPHHRWPGSRTIFGCPFDHHSSCKYSAFSSLFAVLTNRIAGHAIEGDGFIDIVLAADPIARRHDGYRCLPSRHQLWSRVSIPPSRRIRNSV
jgi:hypothetical protein